MRPVLEYCSSAWDPGQIGHIKQVEAVQRKAARFVSGDWSRYSSVTDILQQLGWQSIQERRLIRRLVLMYQAHHGLFAIHLPPYVQPPSRPMPRKHPLQYAPIHSKWNPYMDSFWPRTIRSWNLLPPHIIESSSPEQLRSLLIKAFDDGLLRAASSRDPLQRLTRAEAMGATILF